MLFNFISPSSRVAIGGLEHLVPIGLGLVISFFLFRSAKSLSKRNQTLVFRILGWVVCLTVLIFHLNYVIFGAYNIKTDLPLYLCSLIALLIPIFTHFRSKYGYEILLFWIIAGTLQGVITPDISSGFPTFDYLRYWVVHLGLLMIIFYATFVFGMRPTFKSIFKSFFVLQLYVLMMVLINWLLDANYFYLNQKPKSASILDYFGEWPWYIVVVQLLLIPYFFIIYIPFYLIKRNTKSISQKAD